MIETRLIAALSTIAPTWPIHVPPKADRPCITYRTRSDPPGELTHSGPVALREASFEITVHAPSHSQALTIASQVEALHGKRRGLGPLVDLVVIEDRQDLGYQTEAESWQIAMDAIVHYRED